MLFAFVIFILCGALILGEIMGRYGVPLIVVSALCSAVASIFLKIGAVRVSGGHHSVFDVLHFYLAAVLAYGLGFIAYALALRSGTVSQIYPSMVGVTMLLIFLWNAYSGFEIISMRGVVGSILVVLGIYLLLSTAD